MGERTTFREVTGAGDPAFRPAYALLQRAFPPSELVPASEFLRSLREGTAGVWTDLHWHMIVAERGARVIGVATGTCFGGLNIGTIGYLAIRARSRSAGLGPKLRARLRRAFDQDSRRLGREGMDALIGEIEPDNPWLRRLVRHHHAIPLDLTYFQPPVRPTEPEVPLVLYYQPLRRARKRLPVAEVRRLLYAIWRRGYRIASPLEDARFRRMLRSLEGRKWVGARELPPARGRGPLHE